MDVEKFNENNNSSSANSVTCENNDVSVNDEEYVEAFLDAYPQYRNANIEGDVVILRNNAIVSIVREYFIIRDFQLSLVLFNHSLIDNPEKAYMDLIGSTAGMYGHIKQQLKAYSFVDRMIEFSRAGTRPETISNSSDFVFWDTGTDLYWAIHGFTWKRTRTLYNKAYFKIIDVYDFKKGPGKDIPGVVAGWSGTHDFDVEIYGLVQNGILE